MDDAQLKHLLWQASFGEQAPARAAVAEIVLRQVMRQPVPEDALSCFMNGMATLITSGDAVRFLYPAIPKPARGAPSKAGGKLTRMVEALTLAAARSDGFKDESIDRAEMAGRLSCYQEAARRLGYVDGDRDRAAERMKKACARAEARFKGKEPPGN